MKTITIEHTDDISDTDALELALRTLRLRKDFGVEFPNKIKSDEESSHIMITQGVYADVTVKPQKNALAISVIKREQVATPQEALARQS